MNSQIVQNSKNGKRRNKQHNTSTNEVIITAEPRNTMVDTSTLKKITKSKDIDFSVKFNEISSRVIIFMCISWEFFFTL